MKLQITITELTASEIDARSEEVNSGKLGRSATVQESLDRYFYLIKSAKRALKDRFTSDELSLIADACHATVFQAWSIPHLASNIEVRITLDKLDKKWKIEGRALLAKLQTLTHDQTFALVDAIESHRRTQLSSTQSSNMLDL